MGWVLSFENAIPGGDLVNAWGSPHGGPALDSRVGLWPGVVGARVIELTDVPPF